VIGYCDLEVRGSIGGPAPAGSTSYFLHSGRGQTGSADVSLWLQGAEVPGLSVPSADLPLQHPFVLETPPGWAEVEGGRWVSPARAAASPPGGYEYFLLFAVPPGVRAARLDLLWRAEEESEVAVNGRGLSARGGRAAASEPAGEFRGDITSLLGPGLNRLQFFVGNGRSGFGATGLAFCGQITLSP
jgi:hypothetical protein